MKQYRIPQGMKVQLDKMDPDDAGDYKKTDQGKEKARLLRRSSSEDWANSRNDSMPTVNDRCSWYSKEWIPAAKTGPSRA